MTNEQLTQEVMELKAAQAKAYSEHEKFNMILQELQEDVKATKTLTEDVHIMALNMESMQKTLEATNKKVDRLSLQDYEDYKERKKLVKSNITSSLVGAGCTIVLGFIGWLIISYINTIH